MAVLSKHGHEVERFEKLKKRISIRSTGEVLVDRGDGWKMAKLKPGATVEGYAARLRKLIEDLPQTRPAFWAYRTAVMSEFPSFAQRVRFLTLQSLLGDDLDGLWSELEDAGMGVDLDTLQEIASLRVAVKEELERQKASSPEIPLDAGF